MSTVDTGLGGSVSVELGAFIVAIASSVLMLAFFLIMGRNIEMSVFEVAVTGVVVGIMYYLGLKLQA